MTPFLAITKALSDENRARVVMALTEGELCLCEVIELLGIAPSTVSKHMSVLQQAGLVTKRKDGRWHYYRLAERSATPAVRDALRWARKCLADEETITRDAARLCGVKKKSRETLAACYAER